MGYPETLDAMLAAWNENDASRIRGLLEQALDPSVYFVDPTTEISGIDAFESMVHEVQARIPGAVYSRASDVDSHHNVHRYHWAIHVKGELLVQGFDVTETSGSGKVSKVYGFFGELSYSGSP